MNVLMAVNSILPYRNPLKVLVVSFVYIQKTNIDKFKPILASVADIHFAKIIFIIDRIFEQPNYSYKSMLSIKEKYSPEEKALIKIIDGYVPRYKYKILIAGNHYNGTGAFNIAFHYIREQYRNSDFLWQFCDDDDDLNVIKFNKLIDYITNNDKRIDYKLNPDTHFEHIFYIKSSDSPLSLKFNTTDAEKGFIDDIYGFQFTTDIIINHATATKTHLFESMDTSDCNLWSYLFSPVYFNNISSRLIPFGREDLDLINFLMNAADLEKYNGIYKGKIKSNISGSHDFYIPNNLIRINAIIKFKFSYIYTNNELCVYKYNGANKSGGYDKLFNISYYNPTMLYYMNEHQKILQNKEGKIYPSYSSVGQSQQFYFNDASSYIRKDNNYGIESINQCDDIYDYRMDKEEHKRKTPIDERENVYGEMFIASYIIHEYDKPKYSKLNKTINYMFMNGKTPFDIDDNFCKYFLDLFPEKHYDTNKLRNMFIDIFKNIQFINKWNIDYYNKTHDLSSKNYLTPIQVFGGNKLTFNEIITIIITFIILVIVVVSIIIIIINNKMCKQNYVGFHCIKQT